MPDDEMALSPEEKAIVEQFRQQMADPQGPKTVSVVNESLGSLIDGTKIQFRPGEGKEPSPALGPRERWAARERRRIEALDAARSRAAKAEKAIITRVEKAAEKIKGRNVAETIQYIELQPNIERNAFLLAEEEYNGGRVTVLKSFPPVDHKVRERYNVERAIAQEAATI